jgi:hypothetical protein
MFNKLKILVLIFLLTLMGDSCVLASDSSVVATSTVNPTAAAGQCSYYFIDIVDGTMPGGTNPQGTNLPLNFYNNGSSTNFAPAAPCSGTYKIVFNLNVRANTNVAMVTITPQISSSTGTVIYPAAGGPTNLYLYPQCNNTNFTSTPYCTMGEISGSAQVSLNLGDQIGAPSLTASSSITITGGIISAYLVSSP